MASKKIVLCVDEMGKHESINKGVFELIHKKLIQTLTCIVNTPGWQMASKNLKNEKDLEIGLHLNLTQGKALSKNLENLFEIEDLKAKSILRAIDEKLIKEEILSQYEKFKNDLGQDPHFIDGHRHVHQLPVIRKALFSLIEEKKLKNNLWVRSSCPFWHLNQNIILNPSILKFTGAAHFRRDLQTSKIPHNPYFFGIYDFKTDFSKLFSLWLQKAPSKSLIMCHPGYTSKGDGLFESRPKELEFFKSDLFKELLEKHHIELCKGRDLYL